MARYFIDPPQLGDATWAAEQLDYTKLLPGSRIKKTDFTENSLGYRPIKSGTVVMRRKGTRLFLKATSNLQTQQATVLTAAAAQGATSITVRDADFLPGDSITIGAEAKTISTVNFLTGVITLTAGIVQAGGFAANTVVQLAAAVDLSGVNGEVFITAFPNRNANKHQDIELVKRDTIIYDNFLPDWTGSVVISGTVYDVLRNIYHVIRGVA